MKNLINKLPVIVLATILCSLTACNVNVPTNPANHADPDPIRNGFVIVKFEKPEYVNYVTAVYDKFEEPNPYRVFTCTFKSEYGKNPYIDLGDGYFMSKWSWYWDLYPCDISFAPPVYLLDALWTDVASNMDEYDNINYSKDTKVITTDPVVEIYKFDYDQLDKYFGTDYKSMMPEKYRIKEPVYFTKDSTVIYHHDLSIFWQYVLVGDQLEILENKEGYFATCDSIGHIYMDKMVEAFNTNREELFSIGRNCIDYKQRN